MYRYMYIRDTNLLTCTLHLQHIIALLQLQSSVLYGSCRCEVLTVHAYVCIATRGQMVWALTCKICGQAIVLLERELH
jgi:hypothetical protein